jgi:LacI family transcriptional regulator
MGKITIQDVARTAGVSLATVDRVLNRRAGVKPATIDRVQSAIRQLNYQPDRLAARLARAREYRFCFIFPSGNNSFMVALGEEVRAAAERMASERVSIDLLLTDVFDGEVLAATLESIGDTHDGVAVVALDHTGVREAINAL